MSKFATQWQKSPLIFGTPKSVVYRINVSGQVIDVIADVARMLYLVLAD